MLGDEMQRALVACQLTCAPVFKGDSLDQQQQAEQQKLDRLRKLWQRLQDFNAKNQVILAVSTVTSVVLYSTCVHLDKELTDQVMLAVSTVTSVVLYSTCVHLDKELTAQVMLAVSTVTSVVLYITCVHLDKEFMDQVMLAVSTVTSVVLYSTCVHLDKELHGPR